MKKTLLLLILIFSLKLYSQNDIIISYGDKNNELPILLMKVTERNYNSTGILVSIPTDNYGDFSNTSIIIKLNNNKKVYLEFSQYVIYVKGTNGDKVGAVFRVSNLDAIDLKKIKMKSITIIINNIEFIYNKLKEPEYFINILN